LENSRELHSAIGLAAHGVGIGSFVYLRRVIESLIGRRFQDHKAELGITDEGFNKLRIRERIAALKDHLPDTLVKNPHVYGILSKHIHELSDDECRSHYPVLHALTVMILEEDEEALKKAARKKELEKALQKISEATKSPSAA
jgi:hypothetical protein